jgi:hypothetical protein
MPAQSKVSQAVTRQFIEEIVHHSCTTSQGIELICRGNSVTAPLKLWAYPSRDVVEGYIESCLGLQRSASLSDHLDEVLALVTDAKTKLAGRIQGAADVDDTNWEGLRTDASLVLWATDVLQGWSPSSQTNSSNISVRSRYKVE